MDPTHSPRAATGHRRRLLAQLLALAAVALGTGGVTTFLHYRSEIQQETEHLLDISGNLARLIEASYRYHVATRDVFDPQRALNQTLAEFSSGQHASEGFGTTGRVELWERSGDTLASRILPSTEEPSGQVSTSWHLDPSSPLSRGLEGTPGTWEGPGPEGRAIMAAFRPVEIPDRALVLLVRVDRAEVLRPVIRAAGDAMAVALLLITLGAVFVRRLAEPTIRALATSEERFRSLFQEAPLPYQSLDDQGRFLEINPAFTAAFGHARDELLGRSFAEILTPESQAVFSERFPRFKEAGQIQDAPVSLLTRTNDLREVLINGRFVRGHDGIPGRTHCVLRDVTERLASDRAAREAMEWREAMIEGSRDALFVSDEESRFVLVNQAATDLTGYAREELLGMTIPDLYESVDLHAYREFHDQILAGTPALTEASILRKDGSKVPAEFNNRRISVAGRTYMHTVARDLTERTTMEQAVARTERRFRQLFEGMQEGFALHEMIWAEDGSPKDYRFLEVNPAFETLTGMKPEEILGRTVLEVIPDLEEAWIQRYAEVVRSGEPVTFESHSLPMGRRFRVHAFPGAENEFATVFFDVTEERETQLKLSRSTTRLRALADRLSRIREEERVALSRELHDVLGPVLTGLRMDLESDRAHLPGPVPEPRRRLTAHIRVVDESMELVKDICSRLRTPVLDVLGLGPAIQWQAEELQRRTETQFHLDLPETGPDLDEQQRIAIFRIAQEALTNVLRHSQADNAWISLQSDGPTLTLTIEDDGLGLPPEPERSERGLGLVGMEERATALGGRLSLEARPRGGTVVRVSVPL